MNEAENYTQVVNQHLAASIASHQIDVPVLPDITQKVLSLTQDPESDVSQLEKIIQSDPTLAGHIIHIANSAAYTPNSNLVSLQQAITRLGMTEISNIAIAISLNSKLFRAPGYEPYIRQIWKHSVVTALWAKEVARKLRSNVEAAFLCGLLHNIGKPVIVQAIAELRTPNDSIMDEQSLYTLFSEYEIPVDHIVAQEWGLPEIIAEAITYYPKFDNAPTEPEVAAITLFSHQVANHTLNPEQYPQEELANSSALEFINLYPDEVDDLLGKTDAIKSSAEALSA